MWFIWIVGETMVNKGNQLRTRRKTERLITGSCNLPLNRIEEELAGIGFFQIGADPVTLAMEHRRDELYLEISLDEKYCVHSYLLLTFEEKNKKQRKFRW
jgi:hypothetical protein